ncbi:hypothetical protein AAFF_G00056710 [Aldrovandia affinis]|uniref:Uncharacterized protein n=1 Tax=Aldrovandia affinis TaxID=143900 RepID=A0AAD7S2X7_9TELE|nr:hypothetical protein AAFF_G00056710 [Aldrovandia affinis]
MTAEAPPAKPETPGPGADCSGRAQFRWPWSISNTRRRAFTADNVTALSQGRQGHADPSLSVICHTAFSTAPWKPPHPTPPHPALERKASANADAIRLRKEPLVCLLSCAYEEYVLLEPKGPAVRASGRGIA